MKPEKTHPQRWKLPGALFAGVAAAGLLLQGSTARAQSISSIYPDGTFQFQYTNSLSFVASSSANITNITVVLSDQQVIGGSPFLTILTVGNGVSVSGPANNESVTVALTSNQVYGAGITIQDANGNTATASVSFDTINPSYTFEAEDWDYFNGTSSGQFIDNPQTNAYAHLASTLGVDYNHNSTGSTNYRPYGLSTEGTGDIPRRQYGPPNNLPDYDVGFNNGGDFANYTRTYPAGTYNVYLRGADGNTDIYHSQADAASMGGAATGQFNVQGGGWQTYHWIPMTTNGALSTATFDGTQKTITVYTVGGNYNAQCYMFLPPAVSPAASTVTFTGINPNGSVQFQPTNNFVFDAVSPNPIALNTSFIVIIGATNINGQGSQMLLTGPQLNVTGTPTDRHVTIPITSNTTYSVFIQAVDSGGNPATTSLIFDTVTPAYTWEAEDFDVNGGFFYITNSQTQVDAYPDAPALIAGTDYFYNGGSGPNAYRAVGLGNEGCGDRPRNRGTLATTYPDFDLGNTTGGQWADYTRRDIPPGVYNIYARVSRGNGGTIYDAGRVSQVVAGQFTASQTTSDIGTYACPSTGGWQTYVWMPVTNSAGDLARFTAAANSNITLRVTLDQAQHNAGFFMLMPANLAVNPPPFVSNFLPDGAMFGYTNQLSFTANSSVGIPQNGVTLNLDGVNVVGLGFSGNSSAWNVTYPVTPNVIHTAIITLADSAGTNSTPFVFNTFNPTNYQVEAEDTDYGSGQFKPNSATYPFTTTAGAYLGLAGTSGTDFVESDPNVNETFPYRPSGGGFPTAGAGDQGRIQFTATSTTDYNIGYFGANSWGNYTRTYPGGSYNVWGRVAEGAGTASAVLSTSVSGTTNIQGMFTIPNAGWGTWQWQELSNNNAPAVITLPGAGNTTLQLGGLGNNEVNFNFFMLTPTAALPPSITLTARLSGSTVNLSFLAPTGHNYQVEFSTTLTAQSWTAIGGLITGDNTTHVVPDSVVTGGPHRYYHVKIQ